MNQREKIFNIQSDDDFSKIALATFKFQAINNPVYKKYLRYLQTDIGNIKSIKEIPFLPIEFFKTKKIISGEQTYQKRFISSGTTAKRSSHFIKDLKLYKTSLLKCFQQYFNTPTKYCFIALLPNYLQQRDSSLVFMVNELMTKSRNKYNGFFLENLKKLSDTIDLLEENRVKTLLWGVSYALLDFGEKYSKNLENTLIIETGGMKGRKKELTRKELHSTLKLYFGIDKVVSEYGMTELLSQAYCFDEVKFQFPAWVRVYIRDIYDPFSYLPNNQRGGINIIDLANIYSCSFIETKDIGVRFDYKSFNVIGRVDHTDLRGCSLLID